jgi:hypothetical protein
MKQIIPKHVTTKQRHNKKVKILQGSDPKAQSLKLKLDKRIEMRIDRGDTDPLPHDTIAAIDRGDTDPAEDAAKRCSLIQQLAPCAFSWVKLLIF